jgi:uncharacterized protein YdeI (YjbR/CyaY-like superfamily)
LELHNGINTLHAKTRKEWRKWLDKSHQSEKSVWLIIYHKGSNIKSIYYDEAVEEAICFGWIDSIAHKRDEKSKYQLFSQRKPKSNWSKANRERAEKMLTQGLMTPGGQKLIDLAKKTGTWEALVDVQNSTIPDDLQNQLNKNKTALKNFLAFPPSSKRIILEWIFNAKKEETRQKRVEETVRLAADNIKANHYRQ